MPLGTVLSLHSISRESWWDDWAAGQEEVVKELFVDTLAIWTRAIDAATRVLS
jgi:hypothetical protein